MNTSKLKSLLSSLLIAVFFLRPTWGINGLSSFPTANAGSPFQTIVISPKYPPLPQKLVTSYAKVHFVDSQGPVRGASVRVFLQWIDPADGATTVFATDNYVTDSSGATLIDTRIPQGTLAFGTITASAPDGQKGYVRVEIASEDESPYQMNPPAAIR